ncbi:DEAD/DEAH box helicase, partial [Arthrospira platensis SPKY1]|nr:DEAD/DEAH box helicase [Arthrospira platensis SPKY1]
MYKLLYVSPERLATNLFQQQLPDLSLSFLAVDEAHCISEWGHEFRPAYRRMLEYLPKDIQKVAVTATATPQVQVDMQQVLGMKSPQVVTGSFVRPNLHWWAKEVQRPQEA